MTITLGENEVSLETELASDAPEVKLEFPSETLFIEIDPLPSEII